MDKETVLNVVRRYSELVTRDILVKQVILYGSYANETADSDSDIDIAVVVDKIHGDYLDEQARLYKLRRLIDLRIEPILIEQSEDKSGFLDHILDTGQIVYQSSYQ